MICEKNEKIIYDNPLQPLKIWREYRNSIVRGEWHYHHELEIIVVLKGSFTLIAKNEVLDLSAGSVGIIGSYEPHHSYKRKEGEMEYIVFQFDIFKYLSYELNNLRYFTEAGRLFTQINYIIREKPDVRSQIFIYINEIYKEYSEKEKGFELAIHSLIHRIILALLRNDYKSVLNMNYNAEFMRLLPALEYIENNTNEKISMEQICSLVNMSYSYFGKFFKKVIGKTYREYINYRKILNAERLLLTSDLTVLEIASTVGIPNMANFYKIFNFHNNCTPYEFRKKSHVSALSAVLTKK